MTTYYVDDGGDGTTESSWATADTSINDLDTEYAFASGDIVYFGHDMQCQATNSANLAVTLPSSGIPTYFISATQGSSPPAFAASTTSQIDTSEGSYNLNFDGSIAMYGMSVRAGNNIQMSADSNESCYAEDCRFRVGAGSQFIAGATGAGLTTLINCVIDLTDDGTTNRSATPVTSGGSGSCADIIGLTFVNAAYRTGQIFVGAGANQTWKVSGADLSGFTNGTLCEFTAGNITNNWSFICSNCLTAATWAPLSALPNSYNTNMEFYNVGPASAPTYMYVADYYGETLSSSSIYRTGGQSINSTSTAWLITTQATASEGSPYKTKWIYASVASTGSKNFDVFITNDTADFDDDEVWLEVEYLGTASEAVSAIADDHRVITDTAAAQTDDVSSTWNGSGPSFTYKQKLRVTATVNVAGMYRARVCVGVASIASSRYFYVDPLVTVS